MTLLHSLFATGIYGTVKAVFTVFFGFFIVDRVGRRIPLMVGAVVGSGCLFFIGGYLTAVGPRDGTGGSIAPGDYAAITAIFLYAAWYEGVHKPGCMHDSTTYGMFAE
ncbi:hypothetical protein OIO90_005176 [Microbotryomycetes sp. JL221]|nr:hypothetical protein OIO90_005176 [Microbotryomycetes sp. JL221]